MKRTKIENAVFMITRYARTAKISKEANVLSITNYPELPATDKIGLSTFVHDCPNIVKPLNNELTLLRVV